MTERTPEHEAAYWKRHAQDRLRTLWVLTHSNRDCLVATKDAQEDYPGDIAAEVWIHTDPGDGSLIVKTRWPALHGESENREG